jgi:hypothetical protein
MPDRPICTRTVCVRTQVPDFAFQLDLKVKVEMSGYSLESSSKRTHVLSNPIFLVGCERSGTTMLRLMLNNHPSIAFHHEFEFVVSHLREDGFPEAETFRRLLLQDRIFVDSRFEVDTSLDYRNLVTSFLHQVKLRANKPLVGATIHHAFDRIPDIWPDCRVIHIVRDPRDVARSIVQMGWEGNVWTAARWWRETEEAWERLRGRLPNDRVIEVAFCEIVADPSRSLERICRFIGVAYSEKMLHYHESSTYDPPNPSMAQRWKKDMPKEDVALVEAEVGLLLESHGYERAVRPPIHLSRWRKAWLALHSRLEKWRFRIRRFGFLLSIQDAFARRFGTEAMKDRTRERIWEVQRLYIK